MPLPTVSGNVLEVLLCYLYTGRCLFPRDDLNLGLDLMAAADQFLLMELKQLCQQLLAEKIDAEVSAWWCGFEFSNLSSLILIQCVN